MMFDTYRVGFGTFVDYRGYCYSSEMTVAEGTMVSGSDFKAKLESVSGDGQRTCYDTGGYTGGSACCGESSTVGLQQVGLQHAALGFTSAVRARPHRTWWLAHTDRRIYIYYSKKNSVSRGIPC